MPQKKYKVTLTWEEENILQGIMNRGKHGAQKRKLISGIVTCQRCYLPMKDTQTGR
jgi:hypothetical protein